MSCSTTRTVRPPSSFWIISPVRCVSSSVIPAVGSSRIISFGSCIISMPISSHCRSPCESSHAARFRFSARPIRLQNIVRSFRSTLRQGTQERGNDGAGASARRAQGFRRPSCFQRRSGPEICAPCGTSRQSRGGFGR